MDTEAEAAGQLSTPRSIAKRNRASTSITAPQDAFQVILERLDGPRDVQTVQSERMAAMQDRLDILSAKLDSFTTHHGQ